MVLRWTHQPEVHRVHPGVLLQHLTSVTQLASTKSSRQQQSWRHASGLRVTRINSWTANGRHRPNTTAIRIRLDIVFAVSCILMLLSIVWMFVAGLQPRIQDGAARVPRRRGRAWPSALALRSYPDRGRVRRSRRGRSRKLGSIAEAKQAEIDEAGRRSSRLAAPTRKKLTGRYQTLKADLDSQAELLQHRGRSTTAPRLATTRQDAIARNRRARRRSSTQGRRRRDDEHRRQDQGQAAPRSTSSKKPLTEGRSASSRSSPTSSTARSSWPSASSGARATSFRTLPIIDGFASPTKIHQFTLNDLPIDYNFKYVTRFDRCTTCHLGIDRPAYTKANLTQLTDDDVGSQADKLDRRSRSCSTSAQERWQGLPEAADRARPERAEAQRASPRSS